MRTYEILDANGNVTTSQTVEDSMAPALLYGQHARLTHVNGEKLAKSSALIVGTGDGDSPAMPVVLETVDEAKAARTAAKAAKPE